LDLVIELVLPHVEIAQHPLEVLLPRHRRGGGLLLRDIGRRGGRRDHERGPDECEPADHQIFTAFRRLTNAVSDPMSAPTDTMPPITGHGKNAGRIPRRAASCASKRPATMA